MPIKSNITRNVLRTSTVISDYIFGPALYACSQQLSQELQLPVYFIQQLLAVEDKRFVYHPGFDFLSILRALAFNIGTAPARRHGASTITQQIYSNIARRKGIYKSNMDFKINQCLWAIQRSLALSKSGVLKEYLDSIYFGKSYYGLKQAAKGYCGQNPSDLNIAESFFLVERIAMPNKISIARIAILAERRPIATILKNDRCVVRKLSELYEQHFGKGEVTARCLEKSLRKWGVPTSTCLVAVSNDQ